VLPSRQWRAGVDILSDAVAHPAFDRDELAREIEVVVEEIRRAEDSPTRVLVQQLFALAFDGRPYARPVLGTMDSVRSVTRETIHDFFSRHYVAGNMTVVAVGDLDPDQVIVEVERCFADVPARLPPRMPFTGAASTRPQARVIARGFSETHAGVGWNIPRFEHPDVPALDVLAIVLGQGDSSRLALEVKRPGHANEAGSFSYTPTREGLFTITAQCGDEGPLRTFEAVMESTARLLREGVTDAEVDKAKANILSDAIYQRETVQGLARSLGFYQTTIGDEAWERTYHGRVALASAADVMRVAHQYLRPSGGVAGLHAVALVGKGVPEEKVPTERQLLDVAERALGGEGSRRDRLHARRVRNVEADIERIELDCGAVLYVHEDRSVPVAAIRAMSLGGQRDETASDAGRGYLLAQCMTRGTERRSATEIALEIEKTAGGIGGFAGRNSLGLRVDFLSRHTDKSLDLFLDCLTGSVLPSDELERERELQLEELQHLPDSPSTVAFLEMARMLFVDHPYGLNVAGTETSVKALARDPMLAYLRSRLAPRNLVLAAAGDVDTDSLASHLDAALSGQVEAQAPAANPTAPHRPGGVLRSEILSPKKQAQIVIAFQGTTFDSADRFHLEVLSTVLSGQGGRLFLELRDRQSLAYTVAAMSMEGLEPGYFAFYIATAPEKIDQAVAGLYDQIRRVLDEPIPGEEIDRARRHIAGAYAISLQRRSKRASTFGFNALYGLPRDLYATLPDRILGVTSEAVSETARRILTVGQHVEVVVHP